MLDEPRILSVTEGRTAIGFLLDRGKLGTEAFTPDEQSIGTFKDAPAAATALWRFTHGQMGASNA
jgi:hypothetical protein